MESIGCWWPMGCLRFVDTTISLADANPDVDAIFWQANETTLNLLSSYCSRFFANGTRPYSLPQWINYITCDQDNGWMEQRCLALHMKTMPDAEGWLFIADDVWLNLTRLVDLSEDRIWYPYKMNEAVSQEGERGRGPLAALAATLWERERTLVHLVAKTPDYAVVHPCKLSQPEYAEFWLRTMEEIAQQLHSRFPLAS
jgi:hypothetical protein